MRPYEEATLQAIDIVKSYCGNNEQLKAIFGRGRGKSKIYSEHPELAARLSTFDSKTIRNCFLAIKQSMNTDTMMTDAEGPSNKRARPTTQAGEGTNEAAHMLPRTPPRTKVKAKRPDATPPPPRSDSLFSSSPYHFPSPRSFRHLSPMHNSEEMVREETTLEKLVQEVKNFTFDNVTLRTGDETIAAADPRGGLTLVDPAQRLFDEKCKQAANNSDFAFVSQMQREQVSS